ncbi:MULTISPECIES: toprim domain-containing protein [Pseudomonas]|uniref:Toprim domain-containing protein n=1 Tax=Pseudomonas luteola TaxID=47886 RepID=A0ABS0MYS1_PSELU|nr:MULTISPECIES: toprim domain-containing protein [Pseudomonas]MBA1250151.1 toprim domain-containing protein [Pseudomonas zeshuii]MBH3440902.1 toprim domain-containing protein [Pseudomonas luteola]
MTDHDDQIELQNKALAVSRIYFQNHLTSQPAVTYLGKRSLGMRETRAFELGYAPDLARGLVDHYSSHRVRLAAKDAGLLSTVRDTARLIDFFRGRLMFPIRTDDGSLVGYGGRIVGDQHEGIPKYINTRETMLFDKGKILYGLYQQKAQIHERQEAILVEGYLDVIRLYANGFDYAVAPMGTAITDFQIDLLIQNGVKKLWVCLDGDGAGRKAAQRNIESIMQRYRPELQIMIVNLPDGEDPDSLIRSSGSDSFQRCLDNAVHLPDFIHQVCIEGLPSEPFLEDKALYLSRMTQYIERSGGFLQYKLTDIASLYTGLPSESIEAGKKQRIANAEISNWAPLVMMASRWMIHSESSSRIAAKLANISGTSHGIPELVDLAAQLSSGQKPEGELYLYAVAHGPLYDEEFDALQSNWSIWIKRVQLDESICAIVKMPLNEEAKKNIKMLLR